MSTSPDEVMNTLSWYLVGRAEREQVEQVLADPDDLGVGRAEREQVEQVLADTDDLGPESAELVHELRRELAKPSVPPPKLEPLVRETIEAIAHGD